MCTPYEFKLKDIIIPPSEFFYKICLVRDKSILFLSCLLRFIFYYLVFDILLSCDWISYKDGIGLPIIKMVLFYILLIIVILNLISVILVIYKKPNINEAAINKDVTKALSNINLSEYDKSSLAKRSAGRSKAKKVLNPDILEVVGRPKSI